MKLSRRRLGTFEPIPRLMKRRDGCAKLRHRGGIVHFQSDVAGDVLPAMRQMRKILDGRWRFAVNGQLGSGEVADIRLRIVRTAARSEWYRISVDKDVISIDASDRSGLFYAALRFQAMFRKSRITASAFSLPACELEDYPDFPVRGVMLDVSRGKIPRLESLFRLVELLGELRYNHLQLYFENAFAYPGHEAAWQNQPPFTPDEIAALDHYCNEHCIELTANQNTFGHMEKWLELPEYAHLAELPQGGAPLPWGGNRRYPSALCPTDRRTRSFVKSLLDSLLPCFSSKRVNIGFDEVFDLCRSSRSMGDSDSPAKATGIWLEYLNWVNRQVQKHGKIPLYWADMIHRSPELIDKLPKDAVALEWGYEADHPFEERTEQLSRAGIPFWVCPGTSSWRSIAGRTTNMIENLKSASRAGLKNGAEGFLLTDWGDAGHIQGLCASYPAFVLGGMLAWNVEAHENVDLASAMSRYVLSYDASRDLLAMGDLYLHCGRIQSNSSALFDLLRAELDAPVPEGITARSLDRVLSRLKRLLPAVSLKGLDTADAEELRLMWRMLYVSCEKLQWRKIPHLWKQERDELTHELEVVWNMRNRPADVRGALRRGKWD